MSVDLHTEDAETGVPIPLGTPSRDRRRPNVSGDLPTVLEAGPMFRRTVAGYDRFQVDTYVRWAEDELAAADRERERLDARLLATRAALDEARELLGHSPGGGECLQLSRRIGAVLAAAADEAEALRADAEADRRAAAAEAERLVGYGRRLLADARAEADRVVADAVRRAEEATAAAGRLVDEAEQTRRAACAEAAARLEAARAAGQRAAEDAERTRQRAADDAAAARLHARDEVVRLLGTGREERRRADAEAAATRERLDRDAAARRAALLAEVERLERRRAELRRAEADGAAEPISAVPDRFRLRLRGPLDRLRERRVSRPTA
ncbi:hypothetical protein ACI782_22290 [Geodermatophilus sp. SYSU D00703]